MKPFLSLFAAAVLVVAAGDSQAMSACEVALCMYGKTTGNSGGGECRSAEKKFFSIEVRKKGKFKPNPTFNLRKAYLNQCSEADPDAVARKLGADPAAKSKILNKYGRVPG
ncbi:TPA: conjugal transfer protein [Pseudomonas aeruginosa]|nr:conjugal transfer protein [Pseudomonas aeruginosa]HDQ4723258.1 conjugal transfer protein [Pseudomonas aeruginosa]